MTLNKQSIKVRKRRRVERERKGAIKSKDRLFGDPHNPGWEGAGSGRLTASRLAAIRRMHGVVASCNWRRRQTLAALASTLVQHPC